MASMKKYLIGIIILNIILLSLGFSGCSKQPDENEKQIESDLPKIIQAVSKKFDEANPKNISIKEGVEEVSKKPMFSVSLEGNFTHPWEAGLEKANKLAFSISIENKLWAIIGSKNNQMLWFVKLPSLKWQEIVDLSKEDYWKKVIVENKYINPNEVEWITVEGGLPNPLKPKALFAETDFDKIKKITNIINSAVNKRNSTADEMASLSYSMISPPTVVIKMKNVSKISFWLPYEVVKTKLKHGLKIEGHGYNDGRFVMILEKFPQNEYYTVYSKDVVGYIKSGWQKDMPVKEVSFTATPKDKSLKAGETIVFSGNGCTEKEVKICLQGNGKEKYLIAKVYPKLGKWKWAWTVQKNFTTLDGKEVILKKQKYSLIAEGEVMLLGAVEVDLRR